MKKHYKIFCIALAIAALPISAHADDQKSVPKYLQEQYDRRANEMRAFDTNKDGVVDVKEMQAGTTAKFNAADKNRDGVISPDEAAASVENYKQTNESAGTAAVKQQSNRLQNRYNNADKNKDGVISADEYKSTIGGMQENFDRNGDGVISPEEYRSDGEKLPSYYRNKPKLD